MFIAALRTIEHGEPPSYRALGHSSSCAVLFLDQILRAAFQTVGTTIVVDRLLVSY
jgi:hypothetical protein